MAAATPSQVRKAITSRTPDPVYLIVGDDDAEMSRLASDVTTVVDDELRAFNVERLYAGDKGVTAASIVESARMLPMMADRRVVVVVRAERLLKPKRRGRAAEEETDDGDSGEPASDLDVLTEYVQRPEPSTTLVIAAADVDRTRRVGKALYKHATVVECWGLKAGKEVRGYDLPNAVRKGEALVKAAAAESGQQIEPAAARLLAERAGTDIARLRGDLERLLLFAAGRAKITAADAREVVSAEAAHDDWAVTNAIQQGNTAEALRQLGLALDGGEVPYKIAGQLAWFVREKLAATDPRRVPAAVDALFRTDVDLKSSGGDPRVLLERLVVELCGAKGRR
ncbi:MAG: DNA polymerase III subunit delta [Acidobacteria bacterium]|nr:DNA polymerase III subunit delta [Acidobacteriota bacterium]